MPEFEPESDSVAPKAATSGGRSGGRGIPLSLAQQAALLPERMRRRRVTNLFVALDISPALDVAAFDRAAVAVISRHEILRTIYPDDRRIPYQKVIDAPESAVAVVDSTAPESPALLDAALRDDADHRFDVVHGSPLRIRVHRLPDRDVLSIALHPVAGDDRSVELLVAELFAAYDGARHDAATAPTQYRTVAMAELKTLAGNNSDDPELAWWLERLADLPERADIAVADRESGAGPAQAAYTFRVPTVAAGADLPAEVVHTALVAQALSEAGMGSEVVLGIATSGRHTDTRTALGNFANYLVLQADPADGRTPRQLVETIAGAVAEARAHEGTRIERLTHQIRGAAAVSGGGLFQALVNVRAEGPIVSAAEHTVREHTRRASRPHGVDVVVDVMPGDEGVDVTVDFAPSLAAHPEAAAFARLMERKYAEWAAQPDAPRQWNADVPTLFTREAVAPPGTTGLGGPPRTDAERLLTDAIRRILDLDDEDEVGRADTFFSLGGDSITALKLTTLLAEQGYAVDVQHVFEFPTVSELAEQLESADPAAGPTEETAPAVEPMAASGLDPAALQALGQKFAAQ